MGFFDFFKKFKATAKPAAVIVKPATAPVAVTATAIKKPVAAKPITAAAKADVAATQANAGTMVIAKRVLLQPVVTEKSTVTGTFQFKVAAAATKHEVRQAFQRKYGKLPRRVNIINVLGKTKMRGRTIGKRADWKKAIVYLAKDETVELFQ